MGDKSLRERMLRRMEEVGVSQTELATRVGTSRRNVENWLVLGVQIPAHFVVSFTRAVPVNPAWLLTGEGDPAPVEPHRAVEALRRIGREVDDVRREGLLDPASYTPVPPPED